MIFSQAGVIPSKILQYVAQLDLSLPQVADGRADIVGVLQRSVVMGGKRFRPLLTFLMGDFFGIKLDDLVPLAKSIELVHAASLAHDDVIDNASMRRDRPTLNILTSNKKAILAGDFLLAQVIVDMCQLKQPLILQELAQVIQDLSLGEWLQQDLAQAHEWQWSQVEEVALKKTSSVISWCCVAPAIMAQQDAETVGLVRLMGRSLGLAFQYIDDAIDFQAKDGIVDKDILQDAKNGLINSVIWEVLSKSEDVRQQWQKGIRYPSEWPQELIQQAQDCVRTRAQLELNQARQMFQQLIQQCGSTAYATHRSVQCLMDYLRDRQN